MKKTYLLITFLFIFSACSPSPCLKLEPSNTDRLFFITKAKNDNFCKLIELQKYPFEVDFNDCKKHLQDKYKDDNLTKTSLDSCRSEARFIKDNDKIYLQGHIKIYAYSSHYNILGVGGQIFHRQSIGMMTDYSKYISGYVVKGMGFVEGLNTKDGFENMRIFYAPKHTPHCVDEDLFRIMITCDNNLSN